MTMVEQLARWATRRDFADMSQAARQALKIRVLDSLGCALGALGGEPVRLIRRQLAEFGEGGRCSLIGGGQAPPDRAAFHNGALVRYLDFNDSYLAPGETCHPSDNLGAVLAACEYAGGSGRDLMTALALAYQVQCRLSEVAPVRAKGFDHTVQGSYAAAAGVALALGLDEARTAHAIAISGTAFNALRVTRTGALSHWKGLAYPHTAFCAMHAAFLARQGITGPLEVFEGNKGFMDAIAGDFELDWGREDLERVTRTIIKKFNAEIHSQSAIEGVLELKREAGLDPAQIRRIEVATFDVSFHIIGGGEEGDKRIVHTKEQADHSLPYMLAVALLDGTVMPEQYAPERILRPDVQNLLRRIEVQPDPVFSQRFPAEMPCRLRFELEDGRELICEKRDYEGFFSRPATWEQVAAKFDRLGAWADAALRRDIVSTVANLESSQVSDLTALLRRCILTLTDASH